MEKLLNPIKYIQNIKELPIVESEGNYFREFKRSYTYKKPNGCQCFKDCDCYLEYGKTMVVNEVWYRSVEFDDTDKAFYSQPHIPRDYKLNPFVKEGE